jgi:tRNA(Arg) A34 adenosine deaminase TadA
LSGIADCAQTWLSGAQPKDGQQVSFKERLLAYRSEGFLGPEDEAGWGACVQALVSICENNYGIGALIVDDDFHVVACGHNEICGPPFRSDAHAEMVVLSDFERNYPNRQKNKLTLYTSLEPCPMCYTRILISGVKKVLYVADDDSGGMARRSHLMPDYWRAMADRCAFARAQTRESLRGLALEILLSNMDRLAHEVELVPFVWRNAE